MKIILFISKKKPISDFELNLQDDGFGIVEVLKLSKQHISEIAG